MLGASMSVRAPVVANKFYDGNADTLSNYVQSALDEAQKTHGANAISPAQLVLLPHAGHFFCGHIIAKTLAHVDLPDTLILLGPNHTGKGKELAVWDQGRWQTPLGDIPVDQSIANLILQSPAEFVADTQAHVGEHSLEVILPFLQQKIKNLQIVPIAISGRYLDRLQNAGYSLGNIIASLESKGKKIAIIVSSDMHHFSDHETTLALDELALDAFMQFNPVKLAQIVGEKQISMCGVCPAIVGLYALEKLNKFYSCTLVHHGTSYEKSQDFDRVVGYAGLFVKENTCQNT